MLPFLSQGAAMAIEDGYVLAAALARYGSDVEAALRAYEAERRPRTARVQLEARERGRTYHLSTPEEQRQRDLEIPAPAGEEPQRGRHQGRVGLRVRRDALHRALRRRARPWPESRESTT